jgi:integrase/recombinase XerD
MSALSALFEQFLRERRFLKNVTPKTVTWYQNAFEALTRTVPASAPGDLTKPLLQDFVVRLRERGLSPVSCNTYVKAINAFLVRAPRHRDHLLYGIVITHSMAS